MKYPNEKVMKAPDSLMKYSNEKVMKVPDILMKNILMKSIESARQPNEIS